MPPDLISVYFIRSIREPKGAGLHVGVRQAKVIRHPCPTMRLNGSIYHLTSHGRRRHLDHRDLLSGHLVSQFVHLVGIQDKQSSLID